MTHIIQATEKIDCEHLLGDFIDESFIDHLVNEDTDCYLPIGLDGKREVAFKFRKNYFNKDEQHLAYKGLVGAVHNSANRGLAAGTRVENLKVRKMNRLTDYENAVLDYYERPMNVLVDDVTLADIEAKHPDKEAVTEIRGRYWIKHEIEDIWGDYSTWFPKFIAKMETFNRQQQIATVQDYRENYISTTNVAESVKSGIAGYYDRYPRYPYGRPTSYTNDEPERFTLCFPFMQTLNKGYKELLPERWWAQKKAASTIDPKFLVSDTVFTTITVNKTFRTACHRDAGDFAKGFSNLLVLSENDNYTGGFLTLPEYRIGINIRPGDLLLINNHEIIHGNTPIVLGDEKAHRISLVCYLREGMLDLGSWDYERTRFKFIESRRLNEQHPEWRPLWNGVSKDVFKSEEWYTFLRQELGQEILSQYHPEAVAKTLEGFFNDD